MLLSRTINRSGYIWNQTWTYLADGILHKYRQIANNQDLIMQDNKLQNLTLIEIETLLQANSRSLADFKPIRYPDGYVLQQLGNILFYEERSYNIKVMKTEFIGLFNALTDEQRTIYEKIMLAVTNQK
ncbi:unnamed protein product [Lathyrus sativus]|nr:unnamed protein product [Lathyrus sativus]